MSQIILGQPVPSHHPVQTFTTRDGVKFQVETVATGLEVPWSLAFDPGGDLYFTERPGLLKRIKAGAVQSVTLAGIKEVRSSGEGGLMGLAFHPDYERTHWIYLSYTYEGDEIYNCVVRYELRNDRLINRQVIVDRLPGSRFHNGCRIRFGPDKKLFITTGDATEWNQAQKMNSLGGKILRVEDDGKVPRDNPFPGSPIYSLGHRNPQGLDWLPGRGILFATEHGPSGFEGKGGGGDEVNLIEPGKNYGWPVIHHREERSGFVTPLLEYSPAIAPAGGSFYSGDPFPSFRNHFFFATLRGEHLHRIWLDMQDPHQVLGEEKLMEGVYQRIRDVIEGPDGFIYFCTSNRDGRASPGPEDDRILRMKPIP